MPSAWSLVSVLGVIHFASAAATCPADGAVAITAPETNIWAPLSRSETKNVEDWMYTQKGFNLTRMENATMK